MGIDGWRSMILGIDPGRDKIGWALTNSDRELLLSGICLISEVELFVAALTKEGGSWKDRLSPWVTEEMGTRLSLPEKITLVAVGNGTGSRDAVRLFEGLGIQIIVVDESRTTLEAREFYWSLHRPSLWQRYLPRFLWFPPRSLDDLAAWVIARRSSAEEFCLRRIPDSRREDIL